MNPLQHILVLPIRVYRVTLSPALFFIFGGNGCRFTPTCSQYALDAIEQHGALNGATLAAKRICRCQPWGGCGHDPVPPAKTSGKPFAGNLVSVNLR